MYVILTVNCQYVTQPWILLCLPISFVKHNLHWSPCLMPHSHEDFRLLSTVSWQLVFELLVLFFSKCFHNGFLPIKKNICYAQNVEIWTYNVECHDLISACNVWCHVSREDVKPPLLEKVNKIGLTVVLLKVYQSVVTHRMHLQHHMLSNVSKFWHWVCNNSYLVIGRNHCIRIMNRELHRHICLYNRYIYISITVDYPWLSLHQITTDVHNIDNYCRMLNFRKRFITWCFSRLLGVAISLVLYSGESQSIWWSQLGETIVMQVSIGEIRLTWAIVEPDSAII